MKQSSVVWCTGRRKNHNLLFARGFLLFPDDGSSRFPWTLVYIYQTTRR